jgi:hypothetical protein
MAFCANCGQQVPERAGFCPGCGAPVAVVGSPAWETATQAAKQSGTSLGKKKPKVLPIVIAAVAVIVIAIAALILVNPFGSKDDSGGAGGEDGSADILEQMVIPTVKDVGDRVEFGIWRDEPITWRVLVIEDGRALLVSEKILEERQYDDLDVASSHQTEFYTTVTTWAESDIRVWLNSEFLNTAFTEGEQGAIGLAQLANPDNLTHSTEGGADTEDRVFLLSIDEANRYFSSDSDRIAKIVITEDDIQFMLRIAEDYWRYDSQNLANYERDIRDNRLGQSEEGWWWLRSPGYFGYSVGYHVACVTGSGRVNADGSHVGGLYGIRPALWLKL